MRDACVLHDAMPRRRTKDPVSWISHFSRKRNRLLELLPADDFERLRPHLEQVPLDYKFELARAGKPIGFVYFPIAGVASLVNTMLDGAAAEVGTVGNEGMVGLPIILGDTVTPSDVYVQVPGTALRMPADLFREALADSAHHANRHAALCPRLVQPDLPVGGVQQLSHRRAAMLPVAADDP